MQYIKLPLIIIFSCFCSCTSNFSEYKETGIASYYSSKFHNRLTASGENFNQNLLTAAHKELPFDSRVKVTNIRNGRYVIVRINDRGPFIRGRIIDLSKRAFEKIGNLREGLLKVRVEVL